MNCWSHLLIEPFKTHSVRDISLSFLNFACVYSLPSCSDLSQFPSKVPICGPTLKIAFFSRVLCLVIMYHSQPSRSHACFKTGTLRTPICSSEITFLKLTWRRKIVSNLKKHLRWFLTCCSPWLKFLLFLADLIPAQYFITTYVQMIHKFLPSFLTYFLSFSFTYLTASCDLKLHALPALLTWTVWIESIILFFQNCFPSSTPTSLIIQAKSWVSFGLLSSPLFTTSVSPSGVLFLLPQLLSLHSTLPFSLIYSLFNLLSGLLLSSLTNYHTSSSTFCNLSSIQLPEYFFKMQLLPCHPLDYNSFELPPPRGWSPDSSPWC